MIVQARGGVHGGNCQQSADHSEISDDLMGAEVNGLHGDRKENKARKNSGAQNGSR